MTTDLHNSNIPKHVAIIMDGNGRWAEKRGLSRILGHKNAIRAVREVTEVCAQIGVDRLTLYAFSTENWSRPKFEVNGLMSLLASTIKDELPLLKKNGVRLQPIGNLEHLSKDAQNNLNKAIEETADNNGLILSLALNYSGRWEISDAVTRLVSDARSGKFKSAELDFCSSEINDYLTKNMLPDVDLLIRTSGEYRISNFLLWQLAYAELHFTDVLWPDFRRSDLVSAVNDYQKRERRFGKTSKQVAK